MKSFCSVLRWVLAAIFLYAGAMKAWDPARFALDIASYQLLPERVAVALALYLPWLEIVCGVFLLCKRCTSGALGILMILTLLFLAALSSAWFRGVDVHCGCFGFSNAKASYAWMTGRDLVLFSALLFCFKCYSKKGL